MLWDIGLVKSADPHATYTHAEFLACIWHKTIFDSLIQIHIRL